MTVRLHTVALAFLCIGGGCECAGSPTAAELAGTWDFTWVVLEADGLCAGEVGQESTGEIEIQEGDTADSFTLAGFGEEDAAVLSGTFENGTLSFSGSFPDDSGTTTASTVLDISSDFTSADGTEEWSWESELNPDGCPSGRSSVHAEKQGG